MLGLGFYPSHASQDPMWNLGLPENGDAGARCPSPPLEGGESPCDYYGIERIESSDQLQLGQNRDMLDFGLSDQCNGPNGELLEASGDAALWSLFGPAQLLSASTFTQTFLQGILSSVESRDPIVASAWMETLLDVIDLLPKEVLKRDILSLAINKGQISQPVSSRLLCCKILGKISTKFEPYIIRKEVVPLVQCLCQDTDHEVRGEMCRQLDAVARGIGLEATRSAILPELVELGNDEEEAVQLISVETIVRMLPMLDDETCNQAIIPLVKKLCERALRSRGAILAGVAQQLGRFCHGLAPCLVRDHGHWFLQFFKTLSKIGNSEEGLAERPFKLAAMPDVVSDTVSSEDRDMLCRQACAYNFPAMVLFASPRCFHDELYETYLSLCNDSHPSVRRTIACSFHEVTRILEEEGDGQKSGLDTYQPLLTVLNILLKDQKNEVLEGLIPNLTESLQRVTQGLKSHEGLEAQLADLLHSLVVCEVTTAHASNWRLHADLLTCLSSLPKCLTSDKVLPSFLPLLLHKMHSARPIPCRLAAAYSVLVFVKYTPRAHARQEIIHTLIQEFCLNSSCHKRMLFIGVCELAEELFSKNFFKCHFYKPLLSLAGDRVPNIRLRLCSCLPKLKSLLLMPQDCVLLQKLESCVKKLMIDEKDKDVASAVCKAIEELDEIEVALDPATARRSSCNLDVVVDLEDIRKMEEEAKLWGIELSKETTSSTMSGNNKVVLRRGRIPTSQRPFSTHSWERPKRRSLVEAPSNLVKSSTLPRRRSTIMSEDASKTRSCVSLPSSPVQVRKESLLKSPSKLPLSRIPRVSQGTSPMKPAPPVPPQRPLSPRPNASKFSMPSVTMRSTTVQTSAMSSSNLSRIPTSRNAFRRQLLAEDSS